MSENKELLAVIDGEEITNKDLDSIIERYPVEKRIYFETEQGRKQLLEQKIAFVIMSKGAKEEKLDESQEFLDKIEEIKQQLLTKMLMSKMFKDVSVSEEEIKQSYESNKAAFVEEACIGARHILMDSDEELEKVRNAILNNEISFEDAAKKYSSCPSKEKGGDLGLFKKGMMVKEFEEVAFKMPLNKISPIVKTQFGYHIIKVDEKRDKRQIPFEEVKGQLEKQLIEQKQQKIYEEKLADLKERYSVKVFE